MRTPMQLQHHPQCPRPTRVVPRADYLAESLHVICQQHPRLDHVEKDGGVKFVVEGAQGGGELRLGLGKEAGGDSFSSFM
jgi:hypothetical protein